MFFVGRKQDRRASTSPEVRLQAVDTAEVGSSLREKAERVRKAGGSELVSSLCFAPNPDQQMN